MAGAGRPFAACGRGPLGGGRGLPLFALRALSLPSLRAGRCAGASAGQRTGGLAGAAGAWCPGRRGPASSSAGVAGGGSPSGGRQRGRSRRVAMSSAGRPAWLGTGGADAPRCTARGAWRCLELEESGRTPSHSSWAGARLAPTLNPGTALLRSGDRVLPGAKRVFVLPSLRFLVMPWGCVPLRVGGAVASRKWPFLH